MRIPVRTRRLAGLTLLAAGALAPAAVSAQSSDTFGRTVSFSAGASSFDASGTGTAPTFALRVDAPLRARWMLVEGSLGLSSFDEQFSGSATRFGVLEAQAQLQMPFARLRPYLGLGGGLASYLSNAGGRDRVTGTGSVAAGLRMVVSPRMAARGELRVRGWNPNGSLIDSWVASAAETTIGLSVRF